MDFAIKLLALAGVQGLEPQSALLESVMLPLHHTPINGRRGGIWTLGSNKEQRISNPPHSATMRPLYKMELAMRLERMTSPVPRVCSTNWAIQALEQETGVEPAAFALARQHSTNWITPAKMVETLGVEPSFHRRYHFRALSEVIPMLALEPKSGASANSATPADALCNAMFHLNW